jgi:hypothetical protein
MMKTLIHGSHRYAKGPHGYYLEGDSSSRGVLRACTLLITGVTDATQVTAEISENEWNSELLASETVDSDTPTGGTRFDIAADGIALTIKGFSQTCIAVIAEHVHQVDTGTSYSSHCEISGGNVVAHLTNLVTGADIDMTAINNGKIVELGFAYITST